MSRCICATEWNPGCPNHPSLTRRSPYRDDAGVLRLADPGIFCGRAEDGSHEWVVIACEVCHVRPALTGTKKCHWHTYGPVELALLGSISVVSGKGDVTT